LAELRGGLRTGDHMTRQHIYTVSELTEELNSILEEQYSIVWINGEISNLKKSVSGHFYFTLKDDKAQIQCVIFRGPFAKLKFIPRDGLQVTALGRLSIYPPRGNYQLIAEYLEPQGRGALQAAFEDLKAKLDQEGLFDPAHKRPLPLLPEKISVITSPTGAVRHDIETVILRRFPTMHIELVPVSVQGREAIREIVAALELVDTHHTSQVIILARGGGSLEDLQAFNSEEVARAIHGTTIPVVSAVGHETDYTIADFTADLRAPTPSAAAELAVPVKSELERHIEGLKLLLAGTLKSHLRHLRQQVKEQQYRLKDPRKEVAATRLRLDDLLHQLMRNMSGLLTRRREKSEQLLRMLARNPTAHAFKLFNVRLENGNLNLLNNYKIIFNKNKEKWHNAHLRLHQANPKSILKRGYSITRHRIGGELLTDSRKAADGEELEIILHKGSLEALVLRTDQQQ